MKAVLLTFGLSASTAFLLGCTSEPVDTDGPTVTVLAEGGPLNGTNGLMFGPAGRLYIASVANPSLSAVDPESGEIIEQWGENQGVKGPDDLAFGPDGSIFWTDILVGTVGKRAPDGTASVVASPGPGVNSITFSDDGRLFVSQCFLAHDHFEIDPDGGEEPRLISDQLGPGCGLNGMDWGADGKLYGPRWFHGEVVRVDVDTSQVETVAAGFQTPAAVKFNSQGQLHVLDSLAGAVVRVDLATGTKEVVGRPGPALDNLAFDPTDRLFVSSFADGFVVEVTGPDTVREVIPGGISSPGGLAYVSSTGEGMGRLFLADGFALRELDPVSGAEVHTVRDVIGFSDLGHTLTAHWNGQHLILSTWFDSSVRIWDPNGDQFVARFEGFAQPVDALSFGDDIIVAAYGSGSVVRFSPTASEERTAIASGLQEPAGLAVSGDDLFVADRGAGTVLQILDAGQMLDPPRTIASGLAGPEGIAVAEDGTVFIVEADAGRVVQVNPQDASTRLVADGLALQGSSLAGSPSTKLLSGIAIGDWALFVSGDEANRVYRIEP